MVFKEATENSRLTEMLMVNQKEDLKDIYKKWNDETVKIMKETCEQRKKKRKEGKELRIMRRKRKELKQQLDTERNQEKKMLIRRRREMIQHHITNKQKFESKQKVVKVAGEIMSKGIFNRNAYWDFMKQMKKNKNIRGTSINDKHGKRIDDPIRIKERYKEFYQELLTTREAKTEDER